MLIKGVTLKEKNIIINNFMPAQKMHIKVDRETSMPPKIEIDKDFNCILEYAVHIVDEQKKNLVDVKIAYLILVARNEDDYNPQDAGDKLFKALEPMFMKAINELLKETSYPPLPMNINC